MPKKKQVTFQSNIPGKFIPRDDSPAASVVRPGTTANRFNSKMAELLASSSSSPSTAAINDENEPLPPATKSSQDDPTSSNTPEMTTIDSSRVHSRLIHRRIVTMLETLRRRGGNNGPTSPPTSPKLTPSPVESKSQPITFGQLRQATTSTSPNVVEEIPSTKVSSARSYTDLNTPHHHTNTTSVINDIRSDPINKTSSNKERLYYSPSLEQLLEQHNVVPRMKEQDESQHDEQQQQSKPPLTVDEILATYYSKVKVPTTVETTQPSSYSNNNMNFYMHSSPLGRNSTQNNQHHLNPPRLLLNEQNKNRPPPPSYSSCVTNVHRSVPTTNNLAQHLIRPPITSSIREHVYSNSQIPQHLLTGNSPVTLSTPPISVRPPPPRYEIPTSNIERSHSALSSMNRPNYTLVNPPQVGFDREFSRLLYGKDGGKTRHQRQKRKAFSDPVKKSVEEAGRSVEKTHRRLTTHLNKTDTVTEEEETSSDSNEIDRKEQYSFPRTRFQRQSDRIENNRSSAKKPIVPPNPLLNRPIPSFLRVYSQASPSNDILLQWHLFSLHELESFDAMMTKLYKDENLTRIRFYENYRALLYSTLASKTSSNRVNTEHDDDDNSITTTAL